MAFLSSFHICFFLSIQGIATVNSMPSRDSKDVIYAKDTISGWLGQLMNADKISDYIQEMKSPTSDNDIDTRDTKANETHEDTLSELRNYNDLIAQELEKISVSELPSDNGVNGEQRIVTGEYKLPITHDSKSDNDVNDNTVNVKDMATTNQENNDAGNISGDSLIPKLLELIDEDIIDCESVAKNKEEPCLLLKYLVRESLKELEASNGSDESDESSSEDDSSSEK